MELNLSAIKFQEVVKLIPGKTMLMTNAGNCIFPPNNFNIAETFGNGKHNEDYETLKLEYSNQHGRGRS